MYRGAIAAPRVSFLEPEALGVEGGVPEAVRDALTAMGHNITIRRGLGDAHGLSIEYDASGTPVRFHGGSDPRGRGAARGG